MAKRGSKVAKKAKKKGLSMAKMSNIRKYKRAKRGEMTDAQRQKKKEEKKQEKKATYAELRARQRRSLALKAKYDAEEELYPLTAEVSGEDMMNMIDPEDLTYLVDKNTKKKRKAGEEEEEIEGENEERSFDKTPAGKKVKFLLPIKTDEGIIPQFRELEEETEESQEKKEKKEGEEEEEEEEEEKEEEEGDQAKEEEKKEVPEMSTIDFLIQRQKKLDERKIKIGCLAANFIQEPEERLSGLSSLLHFLDEPDPDVAVTIKKYAALSLLEVFNNIIPSYPIRHHSLDEKLKKETKRVYFYENHLLSGYQIYLKGLEAMLKEGVKKSKSPAIKHMGSVAVRCLGELLNKHPHFNFTSNIIQAIVPVLNHADDDLSSLTTSYITKIFRVDCMGYLSFEIVKKVDQYVRRRAFRVRPEVLKVLLSLKVKDVQGLDAVIDDKLSAKRKLTHKEKLIRKITEQQKKKKSNKEAKLFRKKRKLEEQMKEIREERTTKVRKRQHTGLIQMVFGLYIHVLKRRPNNKLNGTVLEGLAKFAHLINIEFFADLLNVLGGLMTEGTLQFRESLHCIQVVFTILAGQGEVLTLDPHRFFKYLYANILRLSAGTNHDDVESALESLKQMLVEQRRRVNPGRVLAFSKRLATLSLTLLHHGTIPALTTLRSIILTHPAVDALMETDSEGTSGVFSPEVEEPEHSNAAASCFWEFHLLARHHHSTVRQLADHLLRGAPLQGDGTLPFTLTKRSIQELFDMYDSSEMRFNPAVPPPSQHLTAQICSKSKKQSRRGDGNYFITSYMTQETADITAPIINGHAKGNARVNGLVKEEEPGEQFLSEEINSVNFSKGMLANMNLDKIPTRRVAGDDDYTLSLLKVKNKS